MINRKYYCGIILRKRREIAAIDVSMNATKSNGQ
jgi:hypothetical protein